MDTNTLLLIGAAVYFFLLRNPPGARAPIYGASGPGGFQVSGPGFSYRNGPGGTQVALDPATLRTLFGTGGSGTTWGAGQEYALPSDGLPADYYPTVPVYSPFDDPSYVEYTPGQWVPPDFVNDPCFYAPDPSCDPLGGDLSTVW